MSTPIEGLHTAARRFCQEQYSTPWYYRELLHDIEYTIPVDFLSLDDLRTFLLDTSQRVRSMQQKAPSDQEHLAHLVFQEYIEQLDEEHMAIVPPLPFRQYLTPHASAQLRNDWRERWQITGGYWYPLRPRPTIADEVIALQAPWFDLSITPVFLRSLLDARQIHQIWEWDEDGEFIIADTALLAPGYGGLEGFWASKQLDWILYYSHESSVTVGGNWLITAVKEHWPQWDQHIYIDWTFPYPHEN